MYIEVGNTVIKVDDIRRVYYGDNGMIRGSRLYILYEDGTELESFYENTYKAKEEYNKIKSVLIQNRSSVGESQN